MTKPNFDTLVAPNGAGKKEVLPEKCKLSGNHELDTFLFFKAKEIVGTIKKTRLELGKMFNEVFEELSGVNQHDSLYGDWLKLYGFNRMTALRYRRRFFIHEETRNLKTKEAIAAMSDREIMSIVKEIESTDIMKRLKNGMSVDELGNFIASEKKVIELEDPLLENEYKSFFKRAKNIHLNNLNYEQKSSLNNIMKTFNEFLKTLEK